MSETKWLPNHAVESQVSHNSTLTNSSYFYSLTERPLIMAKWVFGFKDLLVKKIQDQQIFYCGCSNLWVVGWVIINPNIVWIIKFVGINGRSLS